MTNSQQFFINTLFLCGVVLNLCYGVKYGKNPDYLSKKQTTAIKGIFVLLVFFGHITQYITMGSAYERIVTSIGQLVVVMFLFYSGYGIMCQIMTKNDRGGISRVFGSEDCCRSGSNSLSVSCCTCFSLSRWEKCRNTV